MTHTGIIATLGPASSKDSVVAKMIKNGLDIVRMNFSHGTHEEHVARIKMIRRLNSRMKTSVKIMQDLEGYRIRIGKLRKDISLKKNDFVYLTQENIAGNSKEIPFDYMGRLHSIKCGQRIFIDDGKIVLEAVSSDKKRLKVRVTGPGLLKENKGVNIPGARLDFEPITDKDKADLEVGIEHKVKYLAQSFVRKAADIDLLRKMLSGRNQGCLIYAKIENQEALKNLDGIIDTADGIIVARGDLGICVPIYKVPVIQKEIVKRCILKRRPVVVATQMLDSMTEEPIPTRAEVSDVANAVLDGATQLLLSGETAVGKYPDKVVLMMEMIIKNTEEYKRGRNRFLRA